MKEKCKYNGHNDKTASIRRPDGKRYNIIIPEDVKDKNFFDWIYPLEDSLTIQYYRELSLDILYNIERDLSTYILGLTFHYDINDGVAEIYNICTYNNTTVYSSIKEIFNTDDPKTTNIIIDELEKHNNMVIKGVKFLPKHDGINIKLEDI